MERSLTGADLARFEASFDADRANHVAMNAAVKSGLDDAASNYEAPRIHLHAFSVDVPAGEATNQKGSGRCWMFAALNGMRLDVMKKLNLNNMELSQNYPLFYDKLEHANYFLETVLETLEEPLDGRLMAYLLKDLMGDGGQWDMFRSLVAKYGVVPQDVMPESFSSSSTVKMNKLLRVKLRGYACELREKASAGASIDELHAEKDRMMETVHRMLTIALGKPPARFTWETRDKDGNFVRISDVTPQEFFAEYVGWNLDDMVTVINAPTADKPFGRTFTVEHLGNIVDPVYPVKYLNLPVEELKRMTVEQLKDGRIVWFGCDVAQFSNKDLGILALDAYDYESLFSTDFPMTKAQRLDYGDSQMTHAMAITGVDLSEDGQPIRWKVENSWGKEKGKEGFYVMSDTWFDEFVYQILLDRKYFTEQQALQYEADPIALKPWDPMGALA